MGLHQFALTYDPVQDRALLRINTTENEEIHCHLTRRYCQLVSQVLQDCIKQELQKTGGDLPSSMDQVLGIEHDSYVQKSDFSQQYEQRSDAHFPLGQEPLLLVKIQIQERDNGVLLILSGNTGVHIELQLTTKLMHGLLKLIEDTGAHADWKLDSRLNTSLQGLVENDSMLIQ